MEVGWWVEVRGEKNNKDKEGDCVELQVEGEAKEEAKGNGERKGRQFGMEC